MSPFVRRTAVARVPLLLILALWPVHLRAQQVSNQLPEGQSQERLLVLQDGGVLRGQISSEGEHYVVARGGGRMRVAASKVMRVCSSLDEAYHARRQQMTRPSAEAHLALAEWCLRNDLRGHAQSELADANSLDPRHPRLALLERRLMVAGQQPRMPTAVAPVAEPSSSQPDATPALPQRANADVSERVVERFTRKVQPVLVNNCTESGCHQRGGAESFQLDRALLHGLANRRSTRSNLAAALALVDREKPELSRLLTVPRRPHGGMVDPVFGPRHEQAYLHLVEWVALVTQSEPAEPDLLPTSELLADALARGEKRLAAEGNLSAPSETAAPLGPEDHEQTPDGVIQAGYEQLAPSLATATRPLRIGAQIEQWQPRDPFDPEIFNRRHATKRPAALPADTSPEASAR
jgi:hypothetical protein